MRPIIYAWILTGMGRGLWTDGAKTQIDGTMGVTAGISEMLIQSNEGYINLLPALPESWKNGSFSGVCARGGFELSFAWDDSKVQQIEILSKAGRECRILTDKRMTVYHNGKKVKVKKQDDGSIIFPTQSGDTYLVKQIN